MQQAAPLPATGRAFKPKPAAESFTRLRDRFAKISDALEQGINTEKDDAMRALLVAIKGRQYDCFLRI